MKKKLVGILMLAILLTACARQTEDAKQTGKARQKGNAEQTETTELTLVSFENGKFLRNSVEAYNRENTEYQITIQVYERSESPEEDGVFRLQREIASGKGPDLIDFGSFYTTSDIVGRYTVDLFSCSEEAEEETENPLGHILSEDCFENILQAFTYAGGLYAVPFGFSLQSFVGARENLGARDSWNVREMIACYRAQKNERMLYPGEQKIDVFGTILTGSMEYYIDWESGECAFDGEDFCDVMAFCNGFPDHLEITEDFSAKQIYLDDRSLLMPVSLSGYFDICRAECIFGEREVSFIGFPVEGGSGTVIKACGPVIAVSRNCADKEAAFDFLAWCLGKERQEEFSAGFPINKKVFEEKLADAMKTEYEESGGERSPKVKKQVVFEGETPVDIFCMTERQAGQLRDLVENAEIASTTDRRLYSIFLDEIAYYFNGDKSLEETAKVIQAKASVYVNERR